MTPAERAERRELLQRQARQLLDREQGYLRLYEREIDSYNALRVAAGTTGYGIFETNPRS